MPISETGTATLGISVARTLRRKANTTRITSVTEISSVRSTSCREARIVGVRSSTMDRVIALGMEASNCGSTSRMWSTVSMIFAPGCRKMTTTTDGLPLDSPVVRRSSTESSTLATSDNCTAAPLRYVTISGMYSSALRI